MAVLNAVFMGTPEIASESLRYIAELQKINIIDIKSVYTKPPAWNSKKKEYIISPVDKLAREQGICVRTPKNLKNNPEETVFLKSLNLDLIIVVAFGLILPQEILDIPRFGVLNLHPSLLPELRGPSPIHYAILNRMKFTGVSIMALDAGVDTGPIISQQRIAIDENEYFQSLYKRLSSIGAFLLAETVKTISKFKINMLECGFPQDKTDIAGDNFPLTELIKPEELKVDFSTADPLSIYAKIRAFTEEGGAFFIFRNKNIKIVEARLATLSGSDDNGTECRKGGIITIADKTGLFVSTIKKGFYIQLLKIKPEAKNIMNYTDFINGFRIKQGEECL
jgi:methionyl-tRNA formyltransferase